MARGKSTRADMRGKPLEKECRRARVSRFECGPNDDRVFCCGLVDPMYDDYAKECWECGAFCLNAMPNEEAGRVK